MSSTTTAAPPRGIKVSNWRAHENKTLRGFFTITFASGLVINDCMLHEKGDTRWIGMPSRPFAGQDGERKFAPIVTFVDRAAEHRLRDLVLAALDRHFQEEVA